MNCRNRLVEGKQLRANSSTYLQEQDGEAEEGHLRGAHVQEAHLESAEGQQADGEAPRLYAGPTPQVVPVEVVRLVETGKQANRES